MATAHALPIYTKLSERILRLHSRPREVTSFNLVTGLDGLWLMLRCPSHAWSWPRANKEERFAGFDAHQTCYKCDSRRFFDSREWQPGPIYRRAFPGSGSRRVPVFGVKRAGEICPSEPI